jgi:hypothetical protein
MLDEQVRIAIAEKIEDMLIEAGGQHGQFVLIVQEIDESEKEIRAHVMTRDTCATCAGWLLQAACDILTEGIKDGRYSVHRLPEVYSSAETLQ